VKVGISDSPAQVAELISGDDDLENNGVEG